MWPDNTRNEVFALVDKLKPEATTFDWKRASDEIGKRKKSSERRLSLLICWPNNTDLVALHFGSLAHTARARSFPCHVATGKISPRKAFITHTRGSSLMSNASVGTPPGTKWGKINHYCAPPLVATIFRVDTRKALFRLTLNHPRGGNEKKREKKPAIVFHEKQIIRRWNWRLSKRLATGVRRVRQSRSRSFAQREAAPSTRTQFRRLVFWLISSPETWKTRGWSGLKTGTGDHD